VTIGTTRGRSQGTSLVDVLVIARVDIRVDIGEENLAPGGTGAVKAGEAEGDTCGPRALRAPGTPEKPHWTWPARPGRPGCALSSGCRVGSHPRESPAGWRGGLGMAHASV
jgi:hypothetical protein